MTVLETKITDIGGQKIELFKMKCSGGCSAQFWTNTSDNNMCIKCSGNDKVTSRFGRILVKKTKSYLVTVAGVTIPFDADTMPYRILQRFEQKEEQNINELMASVLCISLEEQRIMGEEDISRKRNNLVKKISDLRKMLTRLHPDKKWLGYTKGCWKIVGMPSVKKTVHLEAVAVKRKSYERAKPDIQAAQTVMNLLLEEKTDKKKVEKVDDGWDACVEQAKHVKNTVKNSRLIIAGITQKACNIKHGGGDHWNNFKDTKTAKDFALAIGLHYKTLIEWVSVKKLVVDKLPKNTDYAKPKMWKHLKQIRSLVTPTTDSLTVEKLYSESVKTDCKSNRTELIVKQLTNVSKVINRNTFDTAKLTHIKALCDNLSGLIDMKIKA